MTGVGRSVGTGTGASIKDVTGAGVTAADTSSTRGVGEAVGSTASNAPSLQAAVPSDKSATSNSKRRILIGKIISPAPTRGFLAERRAVMEESGVPFLVDPREQRKRLFGVIVTVEGTSSKIVVTVEVALTKREQ
jgi:hypothetical protein